MFESSNKSKIDIDDVNPHIDFFNTNNDIFKQIDAAIKASKLKCNKSVQEKVLKLFDYEHGTEPKTFTANNFHALIDELRFSEEEFMNFALENDIDNPNDIYKTVESILARDGVSISSKRIRVTKNKKRTKNTIFILHRDPNMCTNQNDTDDE